MDIDMDLDSLAQRDRAKNKRGGRGGRGRGGKTRGGRGRRGKSGQPRGTRAGRNRRASASDIGNGKWSHDKFESPRQARQNSTRGIRRAAAVAKGRISLTGKGGGTAIKITNLNKAARATDLREIFATCGKINSVKIQKIARAQGNSAVVVFSTKNAAQQAKKKFNNVPVDNVPMRIEITNSESKSTKVVSIQLERGPARGQGRSRGGGRGRGGRGRGRGGRGGRGRGRAPRRTAAVESEDAEWGRTFVNPLSRGNDEALHGEDADTQSGGGGARSTMGRKKGRGGGRGRGRRGRGKGRGGASKPTVSRDDLDAEMEEWNA